MTEQTYFMWVVDYTQGLLHPGRERCVCGGGGGGGGAETER